MSATVNMTLEEYDILQIDDSTRQLFVVVACCAINASLAFFGIVCNILNVIVFVKMGFKETTNISFLALAVSDLCCLLSVEWIYLCFNPLFYEADLPFVPFEIEYITGGWSHVCFARVSGFITAFITLERCLCIVKPLAVKRILTPTRTTCVIIAIYVCMIISMSPAFGVNLLMWKVYAPENRTRVGIVYTESRDEVDSILLAVNNSCGYIAFLVVTIFTTVLISRLKINRKWRLESIAADNAKFIKSKERKVVKMVLTISTVFVLLSFPVTVVFIGTSVYPQFGTGGKYANLFYICATCAYFLEITNCNTNFFIYGKMSTKFRRTARGMLRLFLRERKINIPLPNHIFCSQHLPVNKCMN